MNPLYEPGSQICAKVRQACFLDKYNVDSIAILPNSVNTFCNESCAFITHSFCIESRRPELHSFDSIYQKCEQRKRSCAAAQPLLSYCSSLFLRTVKPASRSPSAAPLTLSAAPASPVFGRRRALERSLSPCAERILLPVRLVARFVALLVAALFCRFGSVA